MDWASGPAISFSVFYLIPVALTTWYVGKWAGAALALAICPLRLLADVRGAVDYSNPLVEACNLLFGLLALAVVIVLLSKVKSMSQQLNKAVQDRTAALVGEIADREQAEKSLRLLAVQLSDAEEAERTRLAADIHDSIGQSLSVLKLNLSGIAGASDSTGKTPAPLAESLTLIDEIVQQLRTFTFKIHPAMLEDLGLMPTLRWYAEQFEVQAGTQVAVVESGERHQLPGSLATYLFRAIKELINNAAKHGRAKNVVVAVHWRPGGMRVAIDDDGCGFDPALALAPQNRRGLGLAGIRERLVALDGRLAIESKPGKGARIMLDINLA